MSEETISACLCENELELESVICISLDKVEQTQTSLVGRTCCRAGGGSARPGRSYSTMFPFRFTPIAGTCSTRDSETKTPTHSFSFSVSNTTWCRTTWSSLSRWSGSGWWSIRERDGRYTATWSRRRACLRWLRSYQAAGRLFEQAMRLLAAAALVLGQGTAVEDYQVGGAKGAVMRRAARIVGGARRPLPRRRTWCGNSGALQLVPRATPSAGQAIARGRWKVASGGPLQASSSKGTGTTARSKRPSAVLSQVDAAEARAIVRSTRRLRKRRAATDMALGGMYSADSSAAEPIDEADPRCGRGIAAQEFDLQTRQRFAAAGAMRAAPSVVNRTARSRRAELTWLRKMSSKLKSKCDQSKEPERRGGGRGSVRRPTLQWNSPPSAACGQTTRAWRGTVTPSSRLRRFATTAAVAGAALVKGAPLTMAVTGHSALYDGAGNCYGEWRNGSIRFGEARHPGPMTAYDDPEFFDDYEDQECDLRAMAEADGFMAAGIGQVEPLVQDQAGYVDPEHVDFTATVVDIELEEERCRAVRPWWDIRLGEEVRWASSDVESASQEQLLATAFPAPGGRPEHVSDDQRVDDDFITVHARPRPEPQLEEIVVQPPAEGGVPLPQGLFRAMQDEDAARAERTAGRWHQLRQRQVDQRAAVSAARGKRSGKEARSNKAAGLQIQNLPHEPPIEELQEVPVQEASAAEGRSDIGNAPARPAQRGDVGAGAGKVHARRARGRRQRGCHEGELWLLNSSGKPQLEAAIRAANETRGKCVAILNQEHHQGPGRLADLQATAKSQGWTVAAAAAVVGGADGPSAGVAVLTPSHVASGLGVGVQADISPSGSGGRLAQLWCQRVVPSGVLCISMYLHTNEGATPRNVSLVSKALSTAVASGCPWVIAGDMQGPPDEFLRWAGAMLRKAGGHIVATEEPTHYPGRGVAKVLDFFMVADVVAPFIKGAKVLQQVVASPHRAVALAFRNVGPPPLHWQRRAPRPFPRVPPVGCARAPVAPRLDDVDGAGHARAESEQEGGAGGAGADRCEKDSVGKHEYVTRAWSKLTDAIEVELCGRTDRWEGEFPDRRWCGRADGPRYVQSPALPPRAAGAWGSVDMKAHAMAWTANRLSELRNLSAIARERSRADGQQGNGTGLTDGQLKQWYRVASKFLGCRAPIARFLAGEQWEQVRSELRRIRAAPALATDFLEGTSAWVKQLLQAQRSANARCRLKGWRAWVAKQLKNGGSAIHKFAKRIEEAPEELLVLRGGSSADPQDMVDKDFDDWGAVWSKLRQHATAPWRTATSGAPSQLPRPTHGELRAAAATFSPWTGTSSELLTPRHYTWLSDLLLSRIGVFLQLLESWGIWPQQLTEALIRLIPKATGGRRPIGLLASLVRIWERVRRPYVIGWRAKVHRDYNWMSRGRGSARAVWAQTVMEEAARQRGLASAAVLVDLVKAFEMVILARVWSDGLKLGFPRELLRLAMEVCSFGRRLVYRSAYSKGTIHTFTAVLAGSGYATDFMFIMIMRAVDHIILKHDNVDACVIADDVKLSIMGEEDKVARDIGRLTEEFIDVVERQLQMEVSRARGGKDGKTVALVSSGRLAVKVKSKMSRMGIMVARQTRNLGVDFRLGGGQVRRHVQRARASKVAPRQARARRMGGRAAERVAIACDVPSSTYGSSITGVTDGLLASMRGGVASATGSLAGRSVSGRLLMTGRDPGTTVTVGAVLDWVTAWWDVLVPRDCMSDAFRRAQQTVGLSARPNVAVRGGAGAYVAALRRLAWAAPRADVIKTRDGTMLFFGDGVPPEGTWAADPRTVRRWALDDYEAATMSASMVAQDINDVGGNKGYGRTVESPTEGGRRHYGDTEVEAALCGVWRRAHYECVEGLTIPWIWPVARAARAAKRHGRVQGAASLRACVEGGWWTQSRLHANGVAPTSTCKCGDAVGTLWHKLGVCKLTEEARASHVPAAMMRMGKKSIWDPLFSRGVPARPKVPRPPKTRSWWTRCSTQAEQIATGTIFTDGASQGWFWRGARAAWAAVAVTEDGEVLWRLQGIMGEPHPTIMRAELTALRETLRMAAPPLTIYVDNKQVVDGFGRGKAYCTAATTDAADIWREVWHLVDEIGPGLSVLKVRAHTTWWDVIAGKIDPFHRWGNAEADRSAKEALRVAIAEAPHHAYNAQLARAFLWAKWITEYAAFWVDDTTHSPEDVGEAALSGGASRQVRAPRGTLPHEIWQTTTQILCRRCGRERRRNQEGGGFRLEPCRGSAAGRALASARGDKNQLWFRYYFSVADMVRRGASLLARSVVPMALVDLNVIDMLNIEGEAGEAVEAAAAAEAAVVRAAAPHAARGEETVGMDTTAVRTLREATASSVAAGVRDDGAAQVLPASASDQPERNVRRRVAAVGDAEPNLGQGARDGEGVDDDGRRVRQRVATEQQGQGVTRGLWWIRDPSWMPDWMPRLPPLPAEADGAGQREPLGGVDRAGSGAQAAAPTPLGHVLRITGNLVWCARCAAYASRRWGVRLRGACRPGAGDATRSRLEALARGRHPITGMQLL